MSNNQALRGPFVYTKVEKLEGTNKVFGGQCAGLAQWYTHVGLAKHWREGLVVKGNNHLIEKGTAIATFVDGIYPNESHGNHVALYISQDHSGVKVMDQWSSKINVSSRVMSFLGKDSDGSFKDPSNNGDALSVIMVE